jgi:hypothetical protein
MVIGAVDDGHARMGMPEMFAEKQAAKACTEHDNLECFVARHAFSFDDSEENAKRGLHQIRMTFFSGHGLMARLPA